jgi:hypothetical protein
LSMSSSTFSFGKGNILFVMQVSGMQKLIQRQLNEGDLILNTIFYGSLTWLRSPRLSSVPVVSVSALRQSLHEEPCLWVHRLFHLVKGTFCLEVLFLDSSNTSR